MGQPEQDLTLGPGDVLRRDPPLRANCSSAFDELEPILEPRAAQFERRERRRRRDGPPAEPRVKSSRELWIPDTQRRVRDPAAPRQQVERELDRLEVRVARDATEVRGALARRLLRTLDERHALQLVVDERRGEIPPAARERGGQRDRVLHRELRAGADREVCRVRRVAEDDHVPGVPGLVRDLREVEPERAVREELAPTQLVGEQLLAEGEALLLVHLVQSGAAPDRLRALDDEGRHPLVVRVRVCVEEAVLGLAERERERVEHVVSPEPHVLAALGFHLGVEVREPANEAVRSVRADDEVRGRQLLDLDAELERHLELTTALLQDLEEALPRDRGERVAAGRELAPLIPDVDPVPPRERVRDLEVRLRVRVAQRAERLLAEDDAEAERRVRRVSLEHADVDAAVQLLQEDREVEAGRAGADDLDVHASASASRSSSSISDTVGKRTSSSQPASS